MKMCRLAGGRREKRVVVDAVAVEPHAKTADYVSVVLRLLSISLLLSGCPDFPTELLSSETDSGLDSGHSDSGVRDTSIVVDFRPDWPGEGPVYIDTAPVDAAPVDATPVDAAPDSAMAVDAIPADLTPSTDGCVPVSNINPNASTCAQQCKSPTSDSDCDGLGNASQDPWPSTCNKLCFNEELGAAPTLWQLSGGSAWSCGGLELASTASMTLKQPTTLLGPDYLLEVELSFGPATAAGTWSVELHVSDGEPVHYSCAVWVDPAKQPNGGLRIIRHADTVTTCQTTTGWNSTYTVDHSPGKRYLVQTWLAGTTQVCRLVSTAGAQLLKQQMLTVGCVPSSPGTITIKTVNRGVTVHHVRVFAL
jgi:hypothetical protein